MDAPPTTSSVVPTAPSGQVPTVASTNNVSKITSQSFMRQFAPWIISGLVYFVMFLFILVVLPMDPWYAWKRVVAQYITGSEYVVVSGGQMGDDYFDVTIKSAYLKKPGWLFVSAVSPEYDLRCMQIYGKSELLPAGKVRNATIRLPNLVPEVLDETTNQPPLSPGTEITVGIVYDNGTGSFENPILLRDKTGALVIGKTKILRAK